MLPTSRKSTKEDYWCCMFAFPCLLVELAVFHQYIGATGSVPPYIGGTVSAALGGNICSKIKKIFNIVNRQGSAKSPAQIMGNTVMFTLFGVYSYDAYFQSYNNFLRMRVGGGEGKTSETYSEHLSDPPTFSLVRTFSII
jgi:hypothetical protein